jgi:hypothetical protein
MLACFVVLLAACNGEPYPLEGENPTGDLPDQDVDAVLADRAFPGAPLQDDPELGRASLSPSNCSDEEAEVHRKSVTGPGNRVLEEALVCPPRTPRASPQTPPPPFNPPPTTAASAKSSELLR